MKSLVWGGRLKQHTGLANTSAVASRRMGTGGSHITVLDVVCATILAAGITGSAGFDVRLARS